MSGHPYNSVLRSGLTRRLWLIIAFAMLVPVSLAVVSHWLEAEERHASLQNQELTALSRDKASSLLFNSRAVPADFVRDLEGRYLVVLDGAGAARFSNAPVPEELVQLFARRSPHAVDAPGGTTRGPQSCSVGRATGGPKREPFTSMACCQSNSGCG